MTKIKNNKISFRRQKMGIVQTRHDLKRRKAGIPPDAKPVLLSHRRREQAAAVEAKRPHEPRSVQRAKNQARLAALREYRKSKLRELLAPAA